MTRYALPVDAFNGLSSAVFEHFGRSEYFAVVETAGDRILSVTVIHNPPVPEGDEKNLVDFLADHGIEVVLAGTIGPCMSTPLMDRGIRIFKGACGTVEQVIKKYLAGELTEVQKSRYSL